MTTLSELPVPVGLYDDVSEVYTNERNQVHTVVELQEFVRRWRAVWGLADGRAIGSPAAELVAGGEHIDYAQALQCMARNCVGGPGCEHARTKHGCPGIYLMMPSAFITAFFLAQRFGTTVNLALIRLQQVHGNDNDRSVLEDEIYRADSGVSPVECVGCDGTGVCLYCHGTGGPADNSCEICEGSGKCCECRGTGHGPATIEEAQDRPLTNVDRVRAGLPLAR